MVRYPHIKQPYSIDSSVCFWMKGWNSLSKDWMVPCSIAFITFHNVESRRDSLAMHCKFKFKWLCWVTKFT